MYLIETEEFDELWFCLICLAYSNFPKNSIKSNVNEHLVSSYHRYPQDPRSCVVQAGLRSFWKQITELSSKDVLLKI